MQSETVKSRFQFTTMQKVIVSYLRNSWPLLLILSVSFCIRIWNIRFGMPTAGIIWDETISLSYILRLLSGENVFLQAENPYPMLLTLIQLPFIVLHILFLIIKNNIYTLNQINSFFIVSGTGELLLLPRLLSVIFGTGTVYIIFKIFNLIYNRPSAYMAATVAGINIYSVFLSTWSKAHSFMACFIFLALFYTLKFQQSQKVIFLYLSFIFSGLAISIHYLGISSIIFPLICVALNYSKITKKQILLMSIIVISIIISFYSLNLMGIINMVKTVISEFYIASGTMSILPVGKYERFYYIIRDNLMLDPIGLILSFIALIFWIFSNNKKIYEKYLFIGIGFLYLIQISIVAAPQMSRWLLPFSLLTTTSASAFLLNKIIDLKNRKFKIILFFIFILVLMPKFLSVIKWNLLLEKDTVLQAQDWIMQNLKDDDGLYSYNNQIEVPLSIKAARKNKIDGTKMSFSKKNDYIIEHELSLKNNYNLYYSTSSRNICNDYNDDNIGYILISFSNISEKTNILKNLTCISSEPLIFFYPYKIIPNNTQILQDVANNPISMIELLKSDASGKFIEIYTIDKTIFDPILEL